MMIWPRRTSLHRALYWGHLQAAAMLLEAGAQLSIQDNKVLTCFEALPPTTPSPGFQLSGTPAQGVPLPGDCHCVSIADSERHT